MQLNLTRGCIVDSLTIDGKEFNDMSLSEIKSIFIYIIQKETDDMLIRDLLEEIITYHGVETDHYRCECCGDYVETYKLNIDEKG